MATKWQRENPEKARKARKNWYEKNKASEIERAAIRKRKEIERNSSYVRELKSQPCTDCGKSYIPEVMDFDHLGDKIDTICRLVRVPVSLKKLQDEIAKCELVCSNCHRIRTVHRASLV